MGTSLTPIERATLARLKAKDAKSKETTQQREARIERERAAEERERLAAAEKEAATAARIAALGAAADRVWTELSAVVEKRISQYIYREIEQSYEGYHTTERARRAINVMHNNFTSKLAKFDDAGMTPELLEWHFRMFVECEYPSLFVPPPAVDTAAIEQTRLDEECARTARAVIDAGKLRRGEPVDADGIVNLARFRETKKDK